MAMNPPTSFRTMTPREAELRKMLSKVTMALHVAQGHGMAAIEVCSFGVCPDVADVMRAR